MKTPRLVLASASPARLRTLHAGGIDATAIVSDVDESIVDIPDPEALSLALARLKAHAVADQVPPEPGSTTFVLGCDSVLAFDGRLLGKPIDATDATARWHAMRGKAGVLYTGHCVVDVATSQTAEAVASATVHFADITDAEIERYVATGEPLSVAGAFTIDGFGGAFVECIEGDPGTVIGLSLPLLRRLLAELGVSIVTLWRRPTG